MKNGISHKFLTFFVLNDDSVSFSVFTSLFYIFMLPFLVYFCIYFNTQTIKWGYFIKPSFIYYVFFFLNIRMDMIALLKQQIYNKHTKYWHSREVNQFMFALSFAFITHI